MKIPFTSVFYHLKKPFSRHSGLDPESRKSLKPLDSGFRRNDNFTTFVMFCRGLLTN